MFSPFALVVLEGGGTHIFIVVEVAESKLLSEVGGKLGSCLLPCEGYEDHWWVVSVENPLFVLVQRGIPVC